MTKDIVGQRPDAFVEQGEALLDLVEACTALVFADRGRCDNCVIAHAAIARILVRIKDAEEAHEHSTRPDR